MSWEIKPSETRIIVPHLGEKIEIIHPFLEGNYFELASEISDEERPSFSDATSFFNASLNEKDKYSKDIRKKFESNWFYAFNGQLYVSDGVLFENNPEFPKGAKTADDLIMDEKDLKSRLGSREENGVTYSDDGLVRFVPYGFKTGEQSLSDLSKNPYIIALVEGQEQASKLAEFADSYKSKPYLSVITNPSESIKRVVGLYSDWYGDGLHVDADSHGDSGGGFSFRVVRKKISTGN